MINQEVEVWVHCTSEKDQNITLGWGRVFEPDAMTEEQIKIELGNSDWIYDGWDEAYSENSWIFEPGVMLAKKQCEKDDNISFRAALFELYGHFTLTYDVIGIDYTIDYEIDADELMYYLLEDTKDWYM